MSVSDDLVQKIAEDLRARYALDDADLRELGERLAAPRSAENTAFAEQFVDEHRETFDRLSQ